MTETSIDGGIETLFHYQVFNRDHIAEVLLNNRIKFSNPATFNDPWDCKPCFSKTLLSNPKIYKKHVEYFTDLGRRILRLPEEELERRKLILESNRNFMEERIDECTDAMRQGIEKEYRVYCLSTLKDSALMWAHYTDKHTGICLGFKTKANTFCGALRVDYPKDYPLIDLTAEDERELLEKSLLTKANDWSYEQEYRLIAKEGQATDFLVVHDGFLTLDPEELQELTVGCLIDENDLIAIRKLIKASKRDIAVYRASPSKEHYSLVMDRI